MKSIKNHIIRILISLFLIFSMNTHVLFCLQDTVLSMRLICITISSALFILVNIFPTIQDYPTIRLRIMSDGTELLRLFLITIVVQIPIVICYIAGATHKSLQIQDLIVDIVQIILLEAILFWNGIIRVYTTSVQIGLKWRVIGIIVGFVPIVNIIVLLHICRLTREESKFETEKINLDQIRQVSEMCKTKYPILLVHGVFFRDSNRLNYWGRIPKELMINGATLFYGNQESAAGVEINGAQLAKRIKEICDSTGCGKVNIIAHSKGGLDSRYAISCMGISEYVASLTTINTPHHGCIFAEYLLNKATPGFRLTVANTYEKAFSKLGDEHPNFIAAVTDLTNSRCEELNKLMPNASSVYYQSVASKVNKATSGKFPLNVSYPLVKHFDGENDGLVAVTSAVWGEQCTIIRVKGNRGVSHADMIDLNRENIKDFDVREFYVHLVQIGRAHV